jgi:glycosyltransferase involved in cell wall biosynthesis
LEHTNRILICIPAFNEAKNIGDVINNAKKYATEILVYDDGSGDNTAEVAKAAGATVIGSPKNKGYGTAVKMLFEAAREKNADVMVTLDSDGQHDPNNIPDLIEPIMSEGCDMVIGSRFLNDKDRERIPRYRSFGIRTITKLTQVASYHNLTDAQSGFRAYGKNALSKINLFEDGMSVSTEILLRAKEKNLTIREVPVAIRYNIGKSSTHNPISHGAGVLYSVMQFISLRHPLAFYGLPGIALLIIAAFYMSSAVDLFSSTRYISTNMILIAVGTAVVGVVLLATAAILYTITALLKGRIRDI